MTEMFRALMQAQDNGQEFPVYVTSREEADEAASFLKATVVDMVPATLEQQRVEILTTMFSRAFGYR